MTRLLLGLLLLTAGCSSLYAPRDPVRIGSFPSLERSRGDDLFDRPQTGGVDLAPLLFEQGRARPATADPDLLEALRQEPGSTVREVPEHVALVRR